jgi:hypothetical protein
MTNLYCPTLGAARLYAYVKKQGIDVRFKDMNQDTYFTLLSKGYLSTRCGSWWRKGFSSAVNGAGT